MSKTPRIPTTFDSPMNWDAKITKPLSMSTRAIVRFHKDRITVLCHIGHLITSIPTNRSYAGSMNEAELGAHALGQPNRFDQMSAKCQGAGHNPQWDKESPADADALEALDQLEQLEGGE